MADPLEATHGPLVSTEPCASPDTSYILKGKYVTLQNLHEDHVTNLWQNLDLTGAGASIEDYFPGPRTRSLEQFIADVEDLQKNHDIIAYVVKGNLAHLGPGKEGPVGEHDQSLGFIFYDPTRAENREIEVGMMLCKALHRTVASTEAHYLWLRNVCEPDSPGVVGGKSPPYRKVAWKCNSLNVSSKRCAERIGYQLEGTLRKNMITKGRSRDTDLYGFVDDEWPAIKEALELWLREENFDENGQQKRRLQDIRRTLG